MTYFFESAEAVQRLRSAAAEWAGTPFRPFSRAIGETGGISCIPYAEELMIAAGVLARGEFEFTETLADYQGHQIKERVLEHLRGPQLSAIFAEVGINQRVRAWFMPGDLLVLQQHGLFHLPVMLDRRRFTHAISRYGVTEGDIEDVTFRNHIVAAFRARAL